MDSLAGPQHSKENLGFHSNLVTRREARKVKLERISCTSNYFMYNSFVSLNIAGHKCVFDFIEVNSLINNWES
jgi:hypothetical protein